MSGDHVRIAVIGAGAWGTALAANAAAAPGNAVTLWARSEDVAQAISDNAQNEAYLPGVALPASLHCTFDLAEACGGATVILLCVPAQTLASVTGFVAGHTAKNSTLVSCAKGIDRDSGQTMSQIIARQAPGRDVAVLSGPSFADDVARQKPTAVVIASAQLDHALSLCRILSNATLRCYASDDVAGVEIGGALKNVLAIAAGIARGRDLGASAEAALIARGFAEMMRIGPALGGRPETMTGLSGLGDLVLTCASPKSRNFAYGLAIGRGDPLNGLKLAEGAHTASIAAKTCADHGIDAPLVDAVTQILENRLSVDDAIATLLARPIKGE